MHRSRLRCSGSSPLRWGGEIVLRGGFEVVGNEGQRGLLAGASTFGRMRCHCED